MKNRIYYSVFIVLLFSIIGFSQPPQLDFYRDGISISTCDRINTEHLEFSPAYYYDGLVFVSSQGNVSKEDKELDEPFFELFYAGLAPDGQPTKSMYFSPNLNSRLHEGPVAFSPDFKTIYFTRNNIKNGEVIEDREGDVNLQIFKAEKGKAEWENIQPLTFNKPDHNFAHPSLSMDGNQLYFSSNMPGGFGGMDLYVAEKQNGQWGEPKNLGAEINTSGNELFPYIHHSGMLFFSSDKHESIGGLDLFAVNTADPNKKVSNLGLPFNSKYDDLGILVSKNGKTGYFTSARPGGKGKDDLYHFNTPIGLIPENELDLMVAVSDAESGKMLNGASVFVFKGSASGLLENSDLYELEMVPTEDGGQLTLTMVRKSASQIGQPDAITQNDGIASVRVKANQQYIIYVEKEGYLPKDRFYSAFNNETYDKINISLEPHACVLVEGTVLSDKTGVGVPNAIVKFENDCDEEAPYIYSNLEGHFTYCVPRGCDYTITVTKEGFETGKAVVTTKDNGTTLRPIIVLKENNNSFANEPVRKGSVIILDKIYYDFDKSYIRRGAAHDLDALIALMKKYPSMEIEMVAHTDCRGTDEYNRELSLQRARSAMSYVIDRGIDPRRIKAYGAGEKLPRNNCTDGVACSELEHQYNRRTEIKVIEIDEAVVLNYIDQGPEVIDKRE